LFTPQKQLYIGVWFNVHCADRSTYVTRGVQAVFAPLPQTYGFAGFATSFKWLDEKKNGSISFLAGNGGKNLEASAINE